MGKRNLDAAKYIIKIESYKKTGEIKTSSMFDNQMQTFCDCDFIKKRGVESFNDVFDLRQTLNWNLNGDDSKYYFKWGQSGKDSSSGCAYVFD